MLYFLYSPYNILMNGGSKKKALKVAGRRYPVKKKYIKKQRGNVGYGVLNSIAGLGAALGANALKTSYPEVNLEPHPAGRGETIRELYEPLEFKNRLPVIMMPPALPAANQLALPGY